MCGIVGKISFKGHAVNKYELKTMADTIAHRGPDGEGFWVHDSSAIGFGHRRLSIIDLSSQGHQPMHYHHLSITFNGEIYNYIEIKEELIKRGHVFKTKTDTEVVLAAYIEYGEACLNYFDGMFAFVLWDDKRKELFGARDRFGEKPFYYYKNNEEMLFASEMKALFSIGIQKRVSDRMIYKYLVYDVVENPKDKSETFFNEIYQLPASCFVKVNLNGEVSITKYWDIDISKRNELPLNEAAEKFAELFEKSISMRMRSDVKVGSSFSGGLDSSSIVGSILNQSNPIGLNTFTARFEDGNYDEGNFVELMKDKYSFNTNFCWPKDELIIDELDKIFYHQEEPFGSTSIIAQWEVMKLAEEKGVTVLLDGQGADETLAGYYKYFEPYLLELYKTNRTHFTEQLKAIENNLSMTNILSKRFFLGANFPKMLKFLGDTTRKFRVGAIAPDLSDDYRNLLKKDQSPFQSLSGLNDALYSDTFQYGLGKLLRFSDRNAMAHSREVRLPYLSHELVGFAFSLPNDHKMKNGWSKLILRESMQNVLPKEIAWRKDKKGFQAPASWLKEKRVAELVEDSISNLQQIGIIDTPIASKSWQYIMVNKLLS